MPFTYGKTEPVDPDPNHPTTLKRYWFKSPGEDIAEKKANAGGKLWNEANGVLAGVREAGEGGVQGATVRLLDETGVNQIATTTTDASGNYLFEDIAAGIYLAEVVPPGGMRLAAANVGSDTTDSDFDPTTYRVRFEVYEDVSNLDAGLFANANPSAITDTLRTHKNTPAVGNVLLNDTDANGDALTVALATGPQNGTVLLFSNGTFSYTPNTDYTGNDQFTYTLSDGYGGTATGTVNIIVATTTAPTGGSDSYTAAYQPGAGASTGVLANDTDPNGGLTAVLASGPSHGTLELFPDGAFLYTPYDDFTGTDTFTYYPTDADGPGLLTTVTLIVTDTAPTAVGDSATTAEDTAVTLSVLANDTDPDNDTLTVVAASDGLFGTTVVNTDGTITYTPYANWNGTDTFAYLIDDGHGRLALATATVTVTAVNDAPTVDTATVFVQQDAPIDIDLRTLVTDVETPVEELVFTVGYAVNGTIELLADGHTARFTPNAGYYGPASFSLSATDTGDGDDTAEVAVLTAGLSVNRPPTASDATFQALTNTPTTLALAPYYSDPDGDTLTVVAVAQPATGTGSVSIDSAGQVVYLPPTGFTGTVTFTYTVSDGRGGTATASITINVVAESGGGEGGESGGD